MNISPVQSKLSLPSYFQISSWRGKIVVAGVVALSLAFLFRKKILHFIQSLKASSEKPIPRVKPAASKPPAPTPKPEAEAPHAQKPAAAPPVPQQEVLQSQPLPEPVDKRAAFFSENFLGFSFDEIIAEFENWFVEQLKFCAAWKDDDSNDSWKNRLVPLNRGVQAFIRKVVAILASNTRVKQWTEHQKKLKELLRDSDLRNMCKKFITQADEIKKFYRDHVTGQLFNSLEGWVVRDADCFKKLSNSFKSVELEKIGISTIKDVDVLGLRKNSLQLRQLHLFCSVLLLPLGEKNQASYQLKIIEGIENFRKDITEVCLKFRTSADIPHLCQTMLNVLPTTDSKGFVFDDIKKFQNKIPVLLEQDNRLQVLRLQAYIQQKNNFAAWEKLVGRAGVKTLEQFTDVFPSNLWDLYKMETTVEAYFSQLSR